MENDYTAAKGAASYTDNDIKAVKHGGNRISGLDGLRTLAITGVTLFHMFPQTFKGGWLGVSLFFVLTGFLLAYTGEKGREKRSFSLLSYGWKRIKRIYPSLIIMILLTVGVYSFFAPDIIKAVRPEVLSALLGFNNWWQIGQNADYFTRIASQSPFTHLWFLGIEIQYYLLWPLLYGLYIGISKLLNPKAGTAFFLLAGLGAMAVMPYDFSEGMDMTRLYYGTDTRVYALLLGAALGFCSSHKPMGTTCSPWKKKILSFLYGAALLVTGAGYPPSGRAVLHSLRMGHGGLHGAFPPSFGLDGGPLSAYGETHGQSPFPVDRKVQLRPFPLAVPGDFPLPLYEMGRRHARWYGNPGNRTHGSSGPVD